MPNYNCANWFAITISPPPYYGNQFYKNEEDQKYFKRILKRASNHYLILPEWDVSDRLHYHGIIRVDNQYTWYKSSRSKFRNVGFVKLERITSFKRHLGWLMYMKKEWYINRRNVSLYKYAKNPSLTHSLS